MNSVLILLFLYLGVFVFGQLGRYTINWVEINIHLADLLAGLVVFFWWGRKIFKKEQINFPKLGRPIILFFALAFFSLLLNSFFGANIGRWGSLEGREMIVSWLYLFRWLIYGGFYFVGFDLCRQNKKAGKMIFNSLIAVGCFSAVLGLGQYLLLPDMRFLEIYGWDPHYFRLVGTFLDPGFLGMIFVLTLILLTVKIWSASHYKWETVCWGVVYLALALTYSRASYLAYLVAMVIIAFWKKSLKFFLLVLIAGVITVFLLPRPGGEGVRLERESTIRFRLINWSQSLNIIKDHFLFGVGFNAYRYAQRDYGFLEMANWRSSHAGGGADSSLLFVLATTGLFGFLAYLWLWGKIIFVKGRQNLLVLASAGALLVHSLFVNSLFYPWIMAYFWLLLGEEEVRD